MKQYKVFLKNKLIGTTNFEKADPPMGVVFGQINFNGDILDYNSLKSYCIENNLAIATDYAKYKMIAITENIKVITETGVELIGVGGYVLDGMDNAEFEISIAGIGYPFYEQEFPQHTRNYFYPNNGDL